MSTATPSPCHALYYPFHLCHEQTLARLLHAYASVHFRAFMALQLTPWTGTTAAPDRMGDGHPELVATGRLVQGYPVSGPLDAEMIEAVDRDLCDEAWRSMFHTALQEDRRFQRGLFDLTHSTWIGSSPMPGPAFLLRLIQDRTRALRVTVGEMSALSLPRVPSDKAIDHEYGLALIKTSASLRYTIRLCQQHGLVAVTDSASHFGLLQRTCAREQIRLVNEHLQRIGY